MTKYSSLFWDIYSKLYDTLNLLKPYRDLHEQVLTALNLQKMGRFWTRAAERGFKIIISYAD